MAPMAWPWLREVAAALARVELYATLLAGVAMALRLAWTRRGSGVSIKTQVLMASSLALRLVGSLAMTLWPSPSQWLLRGGDAADGWGGSGRGLVATAAALGLSVWTVYMMAQPRV
ncbi:hypothetical protein HK405_011642, partial [Cladochytrium tenue]